jgi:hypothetical protein
MAAQRAAHICAFPSGVSASAATATHAKSRSNADNVPFMGTTVGLGVEPGEAVDGASE